MPLLHHPMGRTARDHPDREAVRCLDASLTYGELDVRAAAMAHHLAGLGVRPGDRVGIHLGKRVEIAVAVYGILRAGAAYVPLDPASPAARLDAIVRDADLRVLITEPSRRAMVTRLTAGDGPLAATIGLGAGGPLPVPDLSWEGVTVPGPRIAPPSIDPSAPAYVLYTSGTTGIPKGILHSHRSARAFADGASAVYGLGPDDRVTNHAPLHFDLSTLDFFATAVGGGTTVILPEPHVRMPASLSELLERERASVLYAVPLALTQLLLHGALDRRDLGALRWIIFAGEPFPPKHLAALMAALPGARFSNIYGPTETNGCTYHHVDVPPDGAPIPIGIPFPGTELRIVDVDDRPVDTGATGELLVRSDTRMVGYLGRPDLTADATFEAVDPDGTPRAFHRTGDLVRAEADGVLHFLGRKDRQVKTRGHRVELDEVEAALLAHADVREAAAFVLPDGHGSHRIEARLVVTGATVPRDLGEHLRDRLPRYAIPERIRTVPELPRTSTGKLDRRRLVARAEEEVRSGE